MLSGHKCRKLASGDLLIHTFLGVDRSPKSPPWEGIHFRHRLTHNRAMPPRRIQSKSHHGCLQCKRRSVKVGKRSLSRLFTP
jgi:hypothetical protein